MTDTVLFTETIPNGIIHKLVMLPAFDLRDTNPAKNFGICCVRLNFISQRENRAVVWTFFTNWYLPQNRRGDNVTDGLGSIDYHSPVPFYEGQLATTDCSFTGGDCYSGGSGLRSNTLFDKFIADPQEVWKTLDSDLLELEERIEDELKMQRSFS